MLIHRFPDSKTNSQEDSSSDLGHLVETFLACRNHVSQPGDRFLRGVLHPLLDVGFAFWFGCDETESFHLACFDLRNEKTGSTVSRVLLRHDLSPGQSDHATSQIVQRAERFRKLDTIVSQYVQEIEKIHPDGDLAHEKLSTSQLKYTSRLIQTFHDLNSVHLPPVKDPADFWIVGENCLFLSCRKMGSKSFSPANLIVDCNRSLWDPQNIRVVGRPRKESSKIKNVVLP